MTLVLRTARLSLEPMSLALVEAVMRGQRDVAERGELLVFERTRVG